MNDGINLVLPIKYDVSDGPYKTTKTLKDAVRQNLKTLFKTNPGDRIMDLNFGIGITRYLFEIITDKILLDIRQNIRDQVSKYLPFIVIDDILINYNKDDNQIYIKFSYLISGLGKDNIFEILVTN